MRRRKPKIKNRALMIVEWEGEDRHPVLGGGDVKITVIPETLTVIISLDGEAEGVMPFGDLQDAVIESIGDLL